MIEILIIAISVLSQILFWLVIIGVILSYVMDPYHPLRRGIDRVVEPMLAPIRRVLPPIGGLDFSPIVLVVLIQVLANLLIRLLSALR